MSVTLTRPVGGIDLLVGEPRQVALYLKPQEAYAAVPRCDRYPLLGGEPELLEALRARHPGKHVVVTCGAKQAIAAALAVIGKGKGGTSPFDPKVVCPAPHWPSYRSLAEAAVAHAQFVSTAAVLKRDIVVLAAPNNPDGEFPETSRGDVDILDCAYRSPAYYDDEGGTVKPSYPPHRCSVWSAGKLYGMPGARVGWIVTEDEGLAEKVAEFVEESVSGAAVPDQLAVAHMVRQEVKYPGLFKAQLYLARNAIVRNGRKFAEALYPWLGVCKGAPIGKGMFAWFRLLPKYRMTFPLVLAVAGVHMLDGWNCGMEEDGWWRANMAVDEAVLERALDQLMPHLSR